MKKIRLVDQTEIEIYNITQSGHTLQIDILNRGRQNCIGRDLQGCGQPFRDPVLH